MRKYQDELIQITKDMLVQYTTAKSLFKNTDELTKREEKVLIKFIFQLNDLGMTPYHIAKFMNSIDAIQDYKAYWNQTDVNNVLNMDNIYSIVGDKLYASVKTKRTLANEPRHKSLEGIYWKTLLQNKADEVNHTQVQERMKLQAQRDKERKIAEQKREKERAKKIVMKEKEMAKKAQEEKKRKEQLQKKTEKAVAKMEDTLMKELNKFSDDDVKQAFLAQIRDWAIAQNKDIANNRVNTDTKVGNLIRQDVKPNTMNNYTKSDMGKPFGQDLYKLYPEYHN